MTTQDDFQDSYAAACRFVRHTVETVLDALREALTDEPGIDREAFEEGLLQAVDGLAAVIYTGQAWCICFGSKYDGAAEEAMGERGHYTVEQRAYFAILAEVRDTLAWENMVHAIEGGHVADYLALTAPEAEGEGL